MDHEQDESLHLRNIDSKLEAELREVGVTTNKQFARLGAQRVYKLLLDAGHEPNLVLRSKLEGAEQDIDWHILAEREKRIRHSRTADQDEP